MATPGLWPVLRGLSDFASKGERDVIPTCVRKGLSYRLLQRTVRDLCPSAGVFPLILAYFARSCPEQVCPPLHSLALLGPSGPCEYAGAASPKVSPFVFLCGIKCCLGP